MREKSREEDSHYKEGGYYVSKEIIILLVKEIYFACQGQDKDIRSMKYTVLWTIKTTHASMHAYEHTHTHTHTHTHKHTLKTKNLNTAELYMSGEGKDAVKI